MPIVYAIEDKLSAPEFVDVLERSGLAARRPVGEPVLLLSAPDAMSYYPHIGMPKADNAFIYQRRR